MFGPFIKKFQKMDDTRDFWKIPDKQIWPGNLKQRRKFIFLKVYFWLLKKEKKIRLEESISC